MDYNVVITSDAEKDLDSFIHYLLFEKKNEQAASSVLDDFEKTKQILSVVAGSLNYCANSQLKDLDTNDSIFNTIDILCSFDLLII